MMEETKKSKPLRLLTVLLSVAGHVVVRAVL